MNKAQLVRYENRRGEIKELLSDVEKKLDQMEEILEASIRHPENANHVDGEEHVLMYLRAVQGSVSSAQLLVIDVRIEAAAEPPG